MISKRSSTSRLSASSKICGGQQSQKMNSIELAYLHLECLRHDLIILIKEKQEFGISIGLPKCTRVASGDWLQLRKDAWFFHVWHPLPEGHSSFKKSILTGVQSSGRKRFLLFSALRGFGILGQVEDTMGFPKIAGIFIAVIPTQVGKFRMKFEVS